MSKGELPQMDETCGSGRQRKQGANGTQTQAQASTQFTHQHGHAGAHHAERADGGLEDHAGGHDDQHALEGVRDAVRDGRQPVQRLLQSGS